MANEHLTKRIQTIMSKLGFEFIPEKSQYVYNTKIEILANPYEPCYEKATIYCDLRETDMIFSYKCNMTQRFCRSFSECALNDLLENLNFDFDLESIELHVLKNGTLCVSKSYNSEILDLEEILSMFLKIVVLLNYTLPTAYRYLEKKQI